MLSQDPIFTQAFEKQQRARIQKEAETTRLLRQLATQDNQSESRPGRTQKWSLKVIIQISARLLHIHTDLYREQHMAER